MNYDQPQDEKPENKIEGISKRVEKLANEIKEKQEELAMLRSAEEIEGIKVSLRIKTARTEHGWTGRKLDIQGDDLELYKPNGALFGVFEQIIDTKKGITTRTMLDGRRNSIEGVSEADKSRLYNLLWKTFHQNDLYNGMALILENDEELLSLIRKIFGNES